MTDLAGQSRSLIGYNQWANERILDAAEGLSAEQYEAIRAPLGHMLGTQLWWYGLWTGTVFEEPHLPDIVAAREAYARSHADLGAFVDALDDAGWHRSKEWWKQWGREGALSVGEVIAQLFYHGIQHRAEIAMTLTSLGRSPGDLDYLYYVMPGWRG